MKKLVLFLLILIFNFLPAFAAKKYYIKNDTDYNLQFLCFSKHNCYNITPTIIEIQNKEFVGFGKYHYYDISSFKYDKDTKTYSVDVLVDRDPSTDLGVCNKSPYDKGNITHLIFSLKYTPSKKDFQASYKGFVTSEDIVQYENSQPISIKVNYLNIYYDQNPEYIKDLSDQLKFFNEEISKTVGKPNSYDYDMELEYILPYYIR